MGKEKALQFLEANPEILKSATLWLVCLTMVACFALISRAISHMFCGLSG